MTEFVFYQVSYKRFVAENPEGTGQLRVVENNSARVLETDGTKKGIEVKALYRTVKKGLNNL